MLALYINKEEQLSIQTGYTHHTDAHIYALLRLLGSAYTSPLLTLPKPPPFSSTHHHINKHLTPLPALWVAPLRVSLSPTPIVLISPLLIYPCPSIISKPQPHTLTSSNLLPLRPLRAPLTAIYIYIYISSSFYLITPLIQFTAHVHNHQLFPSILIFSSTLPTASTYIYQHSTYRYLHSTHHCLHSTHPYLSSLLPHISQCTPQAHAN